MSHAFEENEEVEIIRGSYKSFKKAIYIGPYGMLMAKVLVGGEERNLMLTSIRKKKKTKKTVTIREELLELRAELRQLRISVVAMENKVNDMIN